MTISGVVATLATTGCSDDGLFGGDAGEGDTEGGDGSDPSSGSGGLGTESGGETGDPPDGDSGGDGGPDDGDQGCMDVDCGPGGDCEIDPSGKPACTCEPGYADIGLWCEACAQSGGTLNVDVPMVTISGSITVNGAPPPASQYDHGDVVLVNPGTGDEVRLASTVDGTFSVNVVRGAYEVYYRNIEGGEAVPANRNARLSVVDLRASAQLNIDLQMVTVTGAFFLDGGPPPDSAYERGNLVFRDPSTGDRVDLGSTRDGSYTVSVLPGTYDVHYGHVQGGERVPQNRDARLTQVTVERVVGIREAQGGPLAPAEIDIDVPTVAVTGNITIAGETPPNSQYDAGRLVLRSPGGADQVDVGPTTAGSFDLNVVPGTYDLHYQRGEATDTLPQNGDVVVRTLDVREPVIDLDIPVVTVAGMLTVGGVTPPATAADEGTIWLRDPATDDALPVGATTTGAYDARVVPGSYVLYYRQQTSNGGVPANTNTRLVPLDALEGVQQDIDVPTAMVSGAITVDGAPPPTSEYDDGRVYLKNTETGDTALLGSTRVGTFARLVTPGSYEIRYALETSTDVMPINTDAFLGTTTVNGDSTFDVDVPTRSMGGRITIGGQEPPQSTYDRGRIVLRDVATGDLVYLADTSDGTYTAPVVPGTYLILYEVDRSSGGVPANRSAAFACVELDQAG